MYCPVRDVDARAGSTHPSMRAVPPLCRERRPATAPCSRRHGKPPDGLPMGGGNWMSAGRRRRYLAHRTCTRLALTPIDQAICASVVSSLAFWRTIHANFDSSSLVAALTFRLPICRHFRLALGPSPHADMSARGTSSPDGRRAAAPALPPSALGLAHGPITARPAGAPPSLYARARTPAHHHFHRVALVAGSARARGEGGGRECTTCGSPWRRGRQTAPPCLHWEGGGGGRRRRRRGALPLGSHGPFPRPGRQKAGDGITAITLLRKQ